MPKGGVSLTDITGVDGAAVRASETAGVFVVSGDKWSLSGIHGINKYVWSLLQTELGWTTTPYGGLIPITTPQQQPEFNALNAPYLVYTYAKTTTGEDFLLESETAAYTIFSAKESDIRRVVNLLTAKLNRYDDTADDVNNYIAGNGSSDHKQFDYKYISVLSAQGPQPSAQEGGRHDGLVLIRFRYTHYDQGSGLSVRY